METPKKTVQASEFIKNPDKVEAMQFTGGEENGTEVVRWLNNNFNTRATWMTTYPGGEYIQMFFYSRGDKSEREVQLRPTEWVVKTGHRTVEPMDDYAFRQQFSPAEAEPYEVTFNMNLNVLEQMFTEGLEDPSEVLDRIRKDLGLPTPYYVEKEDEGLVAVNEDTEMTVTVDQQETGTKIGGVWHPRYFRQIYTNTVFTGQADGTIREISDRDIPVGHAVYPIGPDKVVELMPPAVEVLPEMLIVEVQAMQFKGGAEAATPIINWVLANGGTARWSEAHEGWTDGRQGYPPQEEHIHVNHQGRCSKVRPGDWMILDGKGFARATDENVQLLGRKLPYVDSKSNVHEISVHSEDTLFKAAQAIRDAGFCKSNVEALMRAFGKANLLFRERS